MARKGSIESLNRRLQAIPQSVRAALIPAVEKSADELVREMRRNAPEDEGDLKRSIRKEAGRMETSRRVKAGGPSTTKDGYDYAMGQELGTAQMPANPFFYPAKRKLAKRINNRIQREARKAIRKHWGIGK